MIGNLLMGIGFGVALWWCAGFLTFTFLAKVFVYPGAPLSAKIMTVLCGSWYMPLALLRGRIPRVVVAPANDPVAEEKVNEWLRSSCNCPDCRRRRGEDQ